MGFLATRCSVGTSLTRADPERGMLWGWLPPSMLLALTLLAAYPLVLRRLPPHPVAAHEPA